MGMRKQGMGLDFTYYLYITLYRTCPLRNANFVNKYWDFETMFNIFGTVKDRNFTFGGHIQHDN